MLAIPLYGGGNYEGHDGEDEGGDEGNVVMCMVDAPEAKVPGHTGVFGGVSEEEGEIDRETHEEQGKRD
eukprot:evm.model.NODE_17567_length_12782_cov_34.787983.1